MSAVEAEGEIAQGGGWKEKEWGGGGWIREQQLFSITMESCYQVLSPMLPFQTHGPLGFSPNYCLLLKSNPLVFHLNNDNSADLLGRATLYFC